MDRLLKVLRRSPAAVLFVVASFTIVNSVQAQSEAPGYWDNGRWIGYSPLHRKYTQRPGQPGTATEMNAPPEVAVEHSNGRASQGPRPGSQGVVPTAYEESVPVQIEGYPANGMQISPHAGCQGPQCDYWGSYTGPSGPHCEAACCPGMCSRPRLFWVRTEYLGWWKQGMRLPALVTTNPDSDPTLADSNTVVLFGDDAVNKDATSGGRFALGMWMSPCQVHGIEFTYLFLGGETTSYHAGEGNTIVGRPFFDIATGAAGVDRINYPSQSYTGWVNAVAETNFQGTELLYRRAAIRHPRSKVDWFLGWRWLHLKDELSIRESVTYQGTTNNLSDAFNTKNNFNGAEFGIEWRRPISNCWTFELLGKAAIGNSRSAVTIAGQQTGDPDQGLLALDSNSGTHSRNSFSAITELGVTVKRRFGCGLEASFGYTLLYWGDVMRAGDQVDLNVDPRQVPPDPQSATHPGVPMNTTDFWTQGLRFGLEYAF